MKPMDHLALLINRYPVLEPVKEAIFQAYCLLEKCYEGGGKLLIGGNGGSSADSEHIVGELMKGYYKKRQVPEAFAGKLMEADKERGKYLAEKLQQGLPAIALTGHTALSTAYLNDVDGLLTIAQQLYGYGKKGDVFLGISTSGNSENILCAAVAAKARGMQVIGLTGKDGGELKELADLMVMVPEKECMFAQELHLPIYHCWCMMLEDYFFGE